jgi:DNA polymerase III delta subunit
VIYLLYGSDTRKSREKLNEIIAEYRKKSGNGLNIHQFDAEEDTLEKIKDVVDTPSLFSSKKLVLIKYLSLSPWDRTSFYGILEKTKNDPGIIVLLWDRELSVKELEGLKPHCSKTQNFKEIKREVLEPSVFRLGDTFFSSRREGLRSLLDLLDRGHDDFNLFSYLSNYARTLLSVKSFTESRRAVPASYDLHPYVVKKASLIVSRLSENSLRGQFKNFFEEDRKIKTGQTRPKESLIRILLG